MKIKDKYYKSVERYRAAMMRHLCAYFLTKGKLVGVSGRIQTRSYEKDGQKIYTTQVIANNVEFLERRVENGME